MAWKWMPTKGVYCDKCEESIPTIHELGLDTPKTTWCRECTEAHIEAAESSGCTVELKPGG